MKRSLAVSAVLGLTLAAAVITVPGAAAASTAAAEPVPLGVFTCGVGPVVTRDELAAAPVQAKLVELPSGTVTTMRYKALNGMAVADDYCLGAASDEFGIASLAGTRWPRGVIPYTVAAANRTKVADAIAHWEERTALRFVPRSGERNYLDFVVGQGCGSEGVGMQGGRHRIILQRECGVGETIHEIGHGIGLWHEHMRSDRDEFVKVNLQNVISGLESNFDKIIDEGDDIGAYDYGSIMHYSATDGSKNGRVVLEQLKPGPKIGNRIGLSAGDISSVATMYEGIAPPVTTTPPVLPLGG